MHSERCSARGNPPAYTSFCICADLELQLSARAHVPLLQTPALPAAKRSDTSQTHMIYFMGASQPAGPTSAWLETCQLVQMSLTPFALLAVSTHTCCRVTFVLPCFPPKPPPPPPTFSPPCQPTHCPSSHSLVPHILLALLTGIQPQLPH